MNLREFTEIVDSKAKEMSKENLQMAFHSLARKVPEKQRAEFIKIMEGAAKNKTATGKEGTLEAIVKKQDEEEIQKEYARLKEQFEKIEEEELYFYAEGYEDYSSGYWDADWVYEYEDPQGIGRIYEEAAMLLQRSVNDKCYGVAVDLFELLIGTEVSVQDQGDCFTLELKEMVDEHLTSVDCELLAQYVLYAVYQMNTAEKRPKVLYQYCTQPLFRNIQLEKVLSLGGEELEELPQFWDAWIDLLNNEEGDTAGRLLREAVLYQKNETEMIEASRKAAQKHPSLYLAVLEYLEDRHKSDRQLTVGKEAVETIDKNLKVRSEIALKTAEAALETGEENAAEIYRMEAFVSNSTPLNYLRVAAESSEPNLYKERASEIINSLASSEGMDRYGNTVNKEREYNSLSENDRKIMGFLTGDFAASMEECIKIKKGLGWSGRFIKTGIPLFLLLLLNSDQLQAGCREMARQASVSLRFQREEYVKGTASYRMEIKDSGKSKGETDAFWECFQHWKEVYAQEVTKEQTGDYLAALEKMIDKRVHGIVSGQHRNHYESVAALAAALGEVKESRGEAGAKEIQLQKYREEFPRHSALHGELRSYGMTDMRKKKRL